MSGLLLVALVALGSLVALTGVRQLMIDPLANPVANLAWFVLQILPLLLVLPGLLRLKFRSALVASIVAMLYFVHGTLLAANEPMRVPGLGECVAAVALVASAALLARAISRA